MNNNQNNKCHDLHYVHHNHDTKTCLEHQDSLWQELVCHFPFAVSSVAISLIFLSFFSCLDILQSKQLSYHLFHNFHFLHLIFAATGTTLTFTKHSNKKFYAFVAGIFIPVVFCTLSDILLPYLGGKLLATATKFHLCFMHHCYVVVPFLVIGALNGLAMSSHPSSRKLFYSATFHFIHVFVSSTASMLYLMSFDFNNLLNHIECVFVFIIAIVLVPCTLSDVIIPVFFAKYRLHKKT